MTRREEVLTALHAAVAFALRDLTRASVVRNEVMPMVVPPQGLIICRDGTPGDPEVTLSPLTYSYRHRAEIELYAQSTARQEGAVFDAAIVAIGLALAADRTLGGLCDWVESMAPEPQVIAVMGSAPIKAAVITVILHYDTTDPLS